MQKRFGCRQLWPVQPVCSQNWAGAYIVVQVPASDSVPFFKRRPRSYCAKPAQIWSGWPGQVLAKHILSRSKPVCKNHQAPFLAKCGQPSTSFPLSSGSIEFWTYCWKSAWIWFCSGLLCQVLGQMDPVHKQANVEVPLGLI